jgi:hypothetical protein
MVVDVAVSLQHADAAVGILTCYWRQIQQHMRTRQSVGPTDRQRVTQAHGGVCVLGTWGPWFNHIHCVLCAAVMHCAEHSWWVQVS